MLLSWTLLSVGPPSNAVARVPDGCVQKGARNAEACVVVYGWAPRGLQGFAGAEGGNQKPLTGFGKEEGAGFPGLRTNTVPPAANNNRLTV